MDTLEVLAECLAATPAARVHWTQAYTSNLGPSGQLLSYLGEQHLSMKTDGKKSKNLYYMAYPILRVWRSIMWTYYTLKYVLESAS